MAKNFPQDIYYEYTVKGDLPGTICYVKQCPKWLKLCNRFISVFDQKRYVTYEKATDLNEILTIYQKYYRDAFYLFITKVQAALKPERAPASYFSITDENIALCDLEQNQILEAF